MTHNTFLDIACDLSQGIAHSLRDTLDAMRESHDRARSYGLILQDEITGETHVFSTLNDFYRVIDWVAQNADMYDNPLCQIYLDATATDMDLLTNYLDVPTGTTKPFDVITYIIEE